MITNRRIDSSGTPKGGAEEALGHLEALTSYVQQAEWLKKELESTQAQLSASEAHAKDRDEVVASLEVAETEATQLQELLKREKGLCSENLQRQAEAHQAALAESEKTWISTLKDVHARVSNSQAEVATQKKLSEGFQCELAKSKSELASAQEKLATSAAQLQSLKVERDSLRGERDKLNASRQVAENEAEQLRKNLSSERTAYSKELKRQAEAAHEQLKEALEEANDELVKKGRATANDAGLAAEMKNLQAQVSASKAAAAEALKRSNSVQRKLAVSESELGAAKDALYASAFELDEKRRDAAKLEKDLKELQEHSASRDAFCRKCREKLNSYKKRGMRTSLSKLRRRKKQKRCRNPWQPQRPQQTNCDKTVTER